MFGYVRPNKPELKLKEFSQYRAVYCGLCVTIKREYGEIPRLSTNYDLTFMALLLTAFSEDEPSVSMERCILSPIRKHGIMDRHEVLKFTAAVAILLSYEKFKDNVQDGDRRLLNQAAMLIYQRAARQAKQAFKASALIIEEGMIACHALEIREENPAPRFGQMLAELFSLYLDEMAIDPISKEFLGLTARDLGEWIYYMDALEDYDLDKEHLEFNALSTLSDIDVTDEEITFHLEHIERNENNSVEPLTDALETKVKDQVRAVKVLAELEQRMDRHLALLEYKRFGDIVYNIICEGLFEVRMYVLRGASLDRL